MRPFRIFLFAALAATLLGGTEELSAQSAAKLSRDAKRAQRQERITARANAATQVKLREGKAPGYNRLTKSTSYALMYTEGLRYYNMKKKGSDKNSLSNLRKAQTLLDLAIRSGAFTGSPQEDSLYYFYGSSLFQAQDFTTSQEIFDGFRRRFGGSKFLEEAEYKYSAGFYYLSPDPQHDQSVTLLGINAITEFLGRFPETAHKEISLERLEELRRKLYAKSYENARLYYTIGQYKAAVRALGNAIDEFPSSPYREELMYLATRSAYLLAKNSVASLMTDRYLAMMDNYYNLVSEYPETRYMREVETMRDEARAHIDAHTSDGGVTSAAQ
jgi:outer membrane protein assembly factor BamD